MQRREKLPEAGQRWAAAALPLQSWASGIVAHVTIPHGNLLFIRCADRSPKHL